MRIDSHQHFWEYKPKDYGWINDSMKRIRRNFSPGDLKPMLDEFHLDGCVSVQAVESYRETDYLLDLADQNPWILGVIGWADLTSGKLEEKLEEYNEHPKLKGFREVLQSKDPRYMLQENFIRGLQTLHSKGYTYDILIYPQHLKAVLELVKKCPNQSFVIDHLAKPFIQKGEWKEWQKHLAPIAERELIYCKISGMVTEADWKNWNKDQLYPYLEIALELFGPQRLMFGSDWPVCLLAAEYEQVIGVVEEFTDTLSKNEKSWIMGDTAEKFYKLS